MRRIVSLVVVAMVNFGCAQVGSQHSAATHNLRLVSFPSLYASDSDFINLVNDDRTIREEAVRNVSVYYNCLIKTQPANYQRQDPIVIIVRTQVAAFSEIPGKIYDARLEKLAGLITDSNKSAIQSTVDEEIRELNRIKWNDVKREVNLIVTGGRAAELKKYGCPISDADIEKHRLQLTLGWPVGLLYANRPPFVPPFM
jgi:hypothetical protein